MAITIRDLKPGAAPVKRNIASLVGGVVVAIGCFVLWLLVCSQVTQWPPNLGLVAAGAVVSLAIGVWIRVADL